ncbi:hypothetical protein DFH09DRAFT_209902 [Mycena vulgaris]|nr:hypothetical protein DFH09DRAFT_209902 [Mycena vulgaris]
MYTAQRSASTSAYPHFTSPSPVSAFVPEDEPDDDWKASKRNEIEGGFQWMIQDAKDRLENKLQALTVKKESREWIAHKEVFVKEFHEETGSIRALAQEEFTHELAAERVTRRLTRGGQINPAKQESLVQQQEAILAQIQRENNRGKDSTSEHSTTTNISSTSGSSSAQKVRVPQREASRPTFVPSSYSSSSDVSSREPVASLETVKPSRPGPSPAPQPEPRTRTATAPVPPSSTSDGRFRSLGRSSASLIQERRATGSSASPPYAGAPPLDPPIPAAPPSPSSSRRTPTSPAAVPSPPASAPRWQSSAQDMTIPPSHPAVSSPSSSSPRGQTSQTWNAAVATPIHVEQVAPLRAQRSQASFHATPPANPMQGDHDHAGTSPLRERPSPIDDRAGASPLRVKRPQSTFAAPPSIPIQGDYERADSYPLRSKASQSSIHTAPPPIQSQGEHDRGTQSSSLRTRASQGSFHASHGWTRPEMTDEPEELSDSERVAPMRSTEGVPAGAPPPRPPPQVWKPPMSEEEDKAASNFRRERTGSASSVRKPMTMPMPAPVVDDPPPPMDVSGNAEREEALRRESERSWTNFERSREKDKERERPRHSTASEQLHRPYEHIAARFQMRGLQKACRIRPRCAPPIRLGHSSPVARRRSIRPMSRPPRLSSAM